jgi:hypothetical protein
MRRIFFLLILCGLLYVKPSFAQRTSSEFGYQVSFPVGKFGDFVTQPSWLGISGQWAWYLNKQKQVSLGINASWFYFSDKQGRMTVDLGDQGTYTGFRTNFTNIYGVQGIGQYDLKAPKEKTVPYVKIGLGANYQDQRSDLGLFEDKDDGIQFMTSGEFGIRFQGMDRFGILLAANYHWMPASGELVNTSFVGIKVGIHGFNY